MTADWARLVDWEELFGGKEDPEPRWLVEPFLERGQLSSLYGGVGAGKSLLVQDICGGLATGRSVLGYPPAPPEVVLYLDFENNKDDLIERFRDNFGYTAADLKNLHYASFPVLKPLDTPDGGAQARQLAYELRPVLIIVDTTSRIIAGAENSNDTFNDLYKHTLMPLKGAGITVLRLDHPGKDVDRGQRGGSAKATDVDTVWWISEETKDRLRLTPEKSRNRHAAEFTVQRLGGTHLCRGEGGPLRHEIVRTVLTPSQRELAAALDADGVPVSAGRPQIRSWMKSRNLRSSNDDLTAAIRWRKTARTADLPQDAGQSRGKSVQTASDLGGQVAGQFRQDKRTVPPLHRGDSPVPGLGYDWEEIHDLFNRACKKCLSGVRHAHR